METYLHLFLTRVLPVAIALLIVGLTNLLLRRTHRKSYLGWTGWMLLFAILLSLGMVLWGHTELFTWILCGVCSAGLSIGVFMFALDSATPGGERPNEAIVRMGYANPDDITPKGEPSRLAKIVSALIGLVAFLLFGLLSIYCYLNYLT